MPSPAGVDLPVGPGQQVAGVRKGRPDAVVVPCQVPPDVVAVEVGHEHEVDVLHSDRDGPEVVEQPPEDRAAESPVASAQSRIDQYRLRPGPHQEGAYVQRNVALDGQLIAVGFPIGPGHRREEIGHGHLQAAVRQRRDGDVPDCDRMACHGRSRCLIRA